MHYSIAYLVIRTTLLQLVVLIYPLVVLVCPRVVLVYSLIILVCQLIVLIFPFVCLLLVLVVPSLGLFISDSYNDKMIILMNIIQNCRVSSCSNSLRYLVHSVFTWCTKTSLISLQFTFKLKALILFALLSNKLKMFL